MPSLEIMQEQTRRHVIIPKSHGSGGISIVKTLFLVTMQVTNKDNDGNGGFRNVYFGAGTGRDATTANSNTFMGANAGKHTTGSGNTFFGSGAGHGSSEETKTTTAITTGSNNIFIGKEAGLAGKGGVSKTGDYQLNIGNLIFGKNAKLRTREYYKFFSSNWFWY